MRLLEVARTELRGMQLERVAKGRERKREDVRLSRAQPVEPDSALKL